MDFKKYKYYLVFVSFSLLLFIYSACDGIFPSQTKSNLPSDHNSSFGGFLHAPIRRGESAGNCEQCHGSDLKGGLYNSNGTLVVTQSCYQCHGNIWEGGNGNGGN